MPFYELPGLDINSESIVAVEKKSDDLYVLQLSGIGGYYLTAEQTEVFKKLAEKDKNSKSLSVRSKKETGDIEIGEGTIHPPVNETFVPPIAPDHPLNQIPGSPPANQSLDESISLPEITGKVIDASEDRKPGPTEAKTRATGNKDSK